MNRFQPQGWPTVIPRIITSQPDEMVRFVREVFGGQGEYHDNRPAEIRIDWTRALPDPSRSSPLIDLSRTDPRAAS